MICGISNKSPSFSLTEAAVSLLNPGEKAVALLFVVENCKSHIVNLFDPHLLPCRDTRVSVRLTVTIMFGRICFPLTGLWRLQGGIDHAPSSEHTSNIHGSKK